MNLITLFEEAVSRKASDIHLATGEIPCLRIAGDLTRLDGKPLGAAEFQSLMEAALSAELGARLRSGISVERTISHGDHNFSLTAFRASDDGFVATFRILQSEVPALDQIGEGGEQLVEKLLQVKRGLVLITGPTGSGKTTALCSILEKLNETRPARIFMVERGGPYFSFRSKQGLVTQLHVGQDFETYEHALEVVHHVDPDVVATDDIPTAEALRQVMVLAETGHLVLANLHAESVTDALRKLFDAASGEAIALRRSLSQHLVAISVQRLLHRADRPGRVAAYEWISATPAITNAILHGDMDRVAHLQGSDPECRTLQTALADLVARGLITKESASEVR